jgi:hypothetical protein
LGRLPPFLPPSTRRRVAEQFVHTIGGPSQHGWSDVPVEACGRGDRCVTEDPRDDEQVFSGLEEGRGREVPKVMPGEVSEPSPFADHVVTANDVPRVKRRPNLRREHIAAVMPRVPARSRSSSCRLFLFFLPAAPIEQSGGGSTDAGRSIGTDSKCWRRQC